MQKLRKMDGRAVLPYGVLFLFYAGAVVLYALTGRHNLNADISSEMILAQLLSSEGKTLVTESWIHSTELRLISPVPVYQLGLALFSSWHAARVFSAAILYALLTLSFLYMARGAGLGLSGIYAACVLLLPLNKVYYFLIYNGFFYTMHMVFVFLMLGLVFRMKERKRRALRVVLACVLGAWGGLAGVRMLLILTVPLSLACAVLAIGDAAKCGTWREALSTEAAGMTLGAAISAVCTLMGYAVHAAVLTQRYTFKTFGGTMLGALTPEGLLEQLRCLAVYMGYTGDVPVFSLQGVASLAAIGLFGFLAAALFTMARRREALSAPLRLMVWYTLFAIAVGMVINVLTGGNDGEADFSVGYFLPGILTLFLLGFVLLEKLPCRLPGLRGILMLCLLGVVSLEALCFVRANVKTSRSYYEEVTDLLLDGGYKQGYASFWNCNILTELSDGQIEGWCTEEWSFENLRQYPWLTKKDHLTRTPEGKVFVYIEDYEDTDAVAFTKPEYKIAEYEGASIYGYDSYAELEQYLY